MKVLAVGHSLVIDSNRKFWAVLAEKFRADVSLILPLKWRSNLVNDVAYKENNLIDKFLTNYPIPVYFIGNGSFYFFKCFQIIKILNKTKFDVIVVNQETWALSALQFGILKSISLNRKTPMHLSTYQNIKKSKLRFFHPFERFITSFYQKMLYCESSIQDVLKWKNINNETAYFPLSYDENIYQKKEFVLSRVLRIGYMGRISSEKGIKTLLEAFEILKSEFSVELIIAGNGSMKSELNKYNVKYLGVIPHNKAHLFYQEIDIFILPSNTTSFWKEQFGRVIVESVASGVPVIGSNSGAIPEVLGHIGLSYIFDEGDSKSLVEQIKLMWADMNIISWENKFETFFSNNKMFSHSEVANKLLRDLNIK